MPEAELPAGTRVYGMWVPHPELVPPPQPAPVIVHHAMMMPPPLQVNPYAVLAAQQHAAMLAHAAAMAQAQAQAQQAQAWQSFGDTNEDGGDQDDDGQ
jgi:hypothetical protein